MLFSKKITTTKADPIAEMKSAIGDAIDAARRAGVWPSVIISDLENRLDGMRSVELAWQQERNRPMPIEEYERQARAEEKRAAEQLRRDQREYQEQLRQRGGRE
jgi:hypothetical protein